MAKELTLLKRQASQRERTIARLRNDHSRDTRQIQKLRSQLLVQEDDEEGDEQVAQAAQAAKAQAAQALEAKRLAAEEAAARAAEVRLRAVEEAEGKRGVWECEIEHDQFKAYTDDIRVQLEIAYRSGSQTKKVAFKRDGITYEARWESVDPSLWRQCRIDGQYTTERRRCLSQERSVGSRTSRCLATSAASASSRCNRASRGSCSALAEICAAALINAL